MSIPLFPAWLNGLATASLVLGAVCALLIAADEIRRPQSMKIMNVVWPLCALFGSLIWLALYGAYGRAQPKGASGKGAEDERSMPVAVAIGASHCGAGCVLGDIIAEWLCFAVPAVAVALGWRSIFHEKMFAVWVLDFLVAFGLGIVFQYFAIKPMREVSVGEGIVAAIKADTASITSWQVGMYGGMAAIQFLWFRPLYGGLAPVNSTEFWFAMQIAMLAGFCTAFPMNWLLIKAGLKEKM